jgi:hypothetical protein
MLTLNVRGKFFKVGFPAGGGAEDGVKSGWADETGPEAIEDVLNQETKGEWEYVDTVNTGPNNKVQVIFRKPA